MGQSRWGSRCCWLLLASLGLAGLAQADTVDARCEIWPHGARKPVAVLACQFSQRQGGVSIARADGVRHELSPSAQGPGRYTDETGRAAVRQRGLGARGQIYRLAHESVYVFWDTRGLPAGAAAPASTPRRPAQAPLLREVAGVATDAEVADLHHDGSPELCVQLHATDAQAQGTLLAVDRLLAF